MSDYLWKAAFAGLMILSMGTRLAAAEVYFSPKGGADAQIISRIEHSHKEIDVAVYSFTNGKIADALLDAAKRGVKIYVIMDAEQSTNKNAEDEYLESRGIPLKRLSGIGRGIMHDKFAVFDDHAIVTGSYNWTSNAENNNYENALFSEEPSLVKAYAEEFQKLWQAPAKIEHGKARKSYGRKKRGRTDDSWFPF